MLAVARIEAIVWAAPLSFLIGVGVGLGLSSRFRIIRRRDDEH